MATATVKSGIKKWATLAALEEHDRGPVWVMNNSKESQKGQILLTVPKKAGNGSDMVKIPRTFIPIDITQQVPRSQLVESSEFRKTVNNGLLKLVTPEYAELLLGTEEGRVEQRRITNEMDAARAVLNNAAVVEDEDTEEYVDVKKEVAEQKKTAKAKGSVSIKLKNLVAEANEEGLKQIEICAKIRSYGDLTEKDLGYLAKQYSDKPKIMKFLKEKLKELRDGDEGES